MELHHIRRVDRRRARGARRLACGWALSGGGWRASRDDRGSADRAHENAERAYCDAVRAAGDAAATGAAAAAGTTRAASRAIRAALVERLLHGRRAALRMSAGPARSPARWTRARGARWEVVTEMLREREMHSYCLIGAERGQHRNASPRFAKLQRLVRLRLDGPSRAGASLCTY